MNLLLAKLHLRISSLSALGSGLNLGLSSVCVVVVVAIINKDRAGVLKACDSFQRARTTQAGSLMTDHTVTD